MSAPVTPEHYEEALRLMAVHFSHHVTRSRSMWEGCQEGLAWCLAGKPAPTSTRNRATHNPYAAGTSEDESWQAGWAQGKQLALDLGIIQPTGVIHQLALQDKKGWIEVFVNEDGYRWHITDSEGEPLSSASTSYQDDLTALRDALNACFG